jgi:hypothetical protein
MSTIPYADFIELVFKFGVRPDRPEEDECPRMSDGIWDLAEQCWNKDPKARPTARQIHDTIQLLMMSLLTITPVESKMVSGNALLNNNTPHLRMSILARLRHRDSNVQCIERRPDEQQLRLQATVRPLPPKPPTPPAARTPAQPMTLGTGTEKKLTAGAGGNPNMAGPQVATDVVVSVRDRQSSLHDGGLH